MTSYLILSILLGTLIVLFVYSLVSPSVKTTNILISQDSKLNPMLNGAMKLLGGDIYALIPEETKRRRRHNHNMNKLFITSDNPWNISQTEFFILQILLTLGGFVSSLILFILLEHSLSILALGLISVLIIVLGWEYPVLVYKSYAKDRISAFKTDLPEAIDYLVIALSGGTTGLPAAIERILPYLPKNSVMRHEFSQITNDLSSGKTMAEALDSFARRAPTESIEAFVKALNSANKMSTPIVGILRGRADASRKDLEAEIDKKITTLSTKVMLVFGPTAYICIMIIAMAPSIAQLTKLF